MMKIHHATRNILKLACPQASRFSFGKLAVASVTTLILLPSALFATDELSSMAESRILDSTLSLPGSTLSDTARQNIDRPKVHKVT